MEHRVVQLETKMTQVEKDITEIKSNTDTIVSIMKGAKAAATVADWIVKMGAGGAAVIVLLKWMS